jgi:hypothetical protein
MEHESFFCTACGKKMEPGTEYCPACGSRTASVPAMNQNFYQQYDAKEKLRWPYWLMLIGAVWMLLNAATLFMAQPMVDMYAEFLSETDLRFEDVFFGMSPSELVDMMMITGVISAICCAFCFLGAYFINKQSNWKLAFAFSLVATIAAFPSVFIGGILGLFVLYRIWATKEAFSS